MQAWTHFKYTTDRQMHMKQSENYYPVIYKHNFAAAGEGHIGFKAIADLMSEFYEGKQLDRLIDDSLDTYYWLILCLSSTKANS